MNIFKNLTIQKHKEYQKRHLNLLESINFYQKISI